MGGACDVMLLEHSVVVGLLACPVWESPDTGSDGALETQAIVAEDVRSKSDLTLIKM